MRYQFLSKLRQLTISSIDEDMEELEFLYTVPGNAK